MGRGRLRDRRFGGALRRPTCPTTRTGRSGSRRTGSRRCASRSGSGSTRSSSCRSRSSAARRSEPVLGYEKMLDEHGREMHGSLGQHDRGRGGVRADGRRRHALAVLRASRPTGTCCFGYGPAHEVKRKLLTLWNSVEFLVDYAKIEGFRPRYEDLAAGPDGELRPLDRWLVARTHAARRRGDGGARGAADPPGGRRVRDVRRGPLELVHPPLAAPLLRDDEAAFRTLWTRSCRRCASSRR